MTLCVLGGGNKPRGGKTSHMTAKETKDSNNKAGPSSSLTFEISEEAIRSPSSSAAGGGEEE